MTTMLVSSRLQVLSASYFPKEARFAQPALAWSRLILKMAFSGDFTFHMIVTGVFCLNMLLLVFLPRPFEASTPNELTTLGNLGTFVGIFLGLCPFFIESLRLADNSKHTPNRIDGIAVAAICSVSGMTLALF